MERILTDEQIYTAREVNLAALLGTRPRRPIRCPFHSERTPSFIVYPDNSWHCFGCGAHGNNAVDLIMKLGSSFVDTIEYLSGRLDKGVK